MSYNILEQAIVDAKALREAALKNAETAVLEKYAEEVRGAIDLMLEEETETLEEHDLMSPEAEVAEPVIAAAEDEALCGCPDAEEKVEWELNLNDLRAMSNKMPEGEPMMDPALEEEAFLQESEELDEEIDLVFEEEELEEGEKKPFPDLTGDGKVTQADILKGRGVGVGEKDEKELDEGAIEDAERDAQQAINKAKSEIASASSPPPVQNTDNMGADMTDPMEEDALRKKIREVLRNSFNAKS